ncbi:MAG: MCE family protein [Gemmatimonadetes bacterium]|nr:MCE family protein [Gemmatimonadota bacterium]NIO33382.1 MCE family protein [Gemmatimonadota bacterium]
MARRSKRQKTEIWIGLLAIVCSIILGWGYFWLTGQPLGERGYTVTAILEDAGGLERGDRVHMSGVEVGVVRSVRLEAADRIVVQLWLHRDLRIPQDSRALLQAVGVFGDVIVALEPGSSETTASSGDTLVFGRAPSLMDLAGDLGEQAEALLIKVDRLLADSTIDQVHGGVAALPGTVRGLERLVSESSDEFAALGQSLRATADELQGTLEGAEIEELVADMRELATTASETAASLRQSAESLRSIADKIDRGEGTLGLLVNDPGLYEDLRAAAQNAALLARDIRENPARYLKVSVF